MDLKSNANSPYKKEAKGNYTDRIEGIGVKIKAEIGVMWLQAKECHQPPEARRVKKQIVPRASRGQAVLPAF